MPCAGIALSPGIEGNKGAALGQFKLLSVPQWWAVIAAAAAQVRRDENPTR